MTIAVVYIEIWQPKNYKMFALKGDESSKKACDSVRWGRRNGGKYSNSRIDGFDFPEKKILTKIFTQIFKIEF